MKTLLFKLARSRYAAPFIGFAFAHLTRLMPLDVHESNPHFILFTHPVPFWQKHWLAVPKTAISSIQTLQFPKHSAYLDAIILAWQDSDDWDGLLVNGGDYQDVAQLHFHWLQGADNDGNLWRQTQPIQGEITHQYQTASAWQHPQPTRNVHWVIQADDIDDCFQLAQQLVVEQELSAYSLLLTSDALPLTVHFLSGESID